MDQLFNANLNLTSLESHDDHEIIYMTNIIDDQHNHLATNFKPNIQFQDISVTLQLRESVYSKLENLLNANCKLMLDDLKQDGETIKFMDILERDKQWKCLGCEEMKNKDVLFCDDCKQFRPLEMFKNLIHNPQKVSKFELSFLDHRRRMEKQMILDQDLQDDEDFSDQNKMWFILSGDWLFQWKCFISNKISNSANPT